MSDSLNSLIQNQQTSNHTEINQPCPCSKKDGKHDRNLLICLDDSKNFCPSELYDKCNNDEELHFINNFSNSQDNSQYNSESNNCDEELHFINNFSNSQDNSQYNSESDNSEEELNIQDNSENNSESVNNDEDADFIIHSFKNQDESDNNGEDPEFIIYSLLILDDFKEKTYPIINLFIFDNTTIQDNFEESNYSS